MNQLPEIFRETQQSFSIRRQGPFYSLKLVHPPAANQTSNLQNTANIKTRLKVNRYSIDCQRQSRRRINYSTVSYDHLNDSDFYGTKGKKDKVQSYQVLLHQREKAAEIVGLKVASCRGFKEEYLDQLRNIQAAYKKDLSRFEGQFKVQIIRLKQNLSQLRRETGDQIKSAKNELKQFNNDLLVYCQQFKKVELHHKKVVEDLQQSPQ